MTKSSSDRVKASRPPAISAGLNMRQQHVAECLPIVGAEVARRLLLLLVEARQPRADDQRDEGEAERDMRDDDRAEVERPEEIVGPGQHAGEEQQHGDAHADFRHHERQREGALHHRPAREAVAPQQHRGERADDERDQRGHKGDGQRVGEGDQQDLVVEQLLVISEREAAPDGVALGVVEAEGDQRDQRRVEKEEHAEQPSPHLPHAIIFERRAFLGHG